MKKTNEHKRQLLFPAGFAVGAAGHDATGEVDAPGQYLAAHLGKAAAHALVVAHLAGAVVHVQHGAGVQLCPAHKAGELFRRDPDGRRQRRRTAEDLIVLQHGRPDEPVRPAAVDRKSTRLNSSHNAQSRMPSSA